MRPLLTIEIRPDYHSALPVTTLGFDFALGQFDAFLLNPSAGTHANAEQYLLSTPTLPF
jgi:hypothetical protein